MRLLDEIHFARPFYGSRRLRDALETQGTPVNRKRVQRLVRQMGLRALYPKPRTSQPGVGHTGYPYLLRGLSIERPNQVWATISATSRWRTGSCIWWPSWIGTRAASWPGGCRTPSTATSVSRPSRTRSPATGRRRSSIRTVPSARPRRLRRCSRSTRWPSAWTARAAGVDNVFVERLWRRVTTYEDVYLHAYETPASLRAGLTCYLQFYNGRRRHSSLGRRTPDVVYFGTTGFGTTA